MPVFGGQNYRPRGARGVGGGFWVNTSGNQRRGRRFRITFDPKSGYIYHDYGGGRKVRVRRLKGQLQADVKAPRAPSAPSVDSISQTPKTQQSGTQAGQKPGQGPAKPAALGDDSTASGERANLRFQTAQKLAELAQQGAYDRADLAEANRRGDVQLGQERQQTREGANRQGLFYSGQLGKQQDELASRYARAQFDRQQGFDRGEAGREAARQALAQGASLEEAAISARNADRAVERAQALADANALVAEPVPPAAPGAPGRGNNSAVSALARYGAVRARGLGRGQWQVRFKSGALRTLRLRNGRWEIKRKGGWKPFH